MRKLLTRPWTEDDDGTIREMIARRQPVRHIAHRLRRSQSSVRSRIGFLGLHVSPETQTIRQMRQAIFPASERRFG